jgi:undecaprenyl-diphosphatase
MKTIKNPHPPNNKGKSINQKQTLTLSTILLIAFLAFTLTRNNFSTIDQNTNTWANTINKSNLTPIAIAIHIAFDTPALILLSIIIGITLLLLHSKKSGLLMLTAMLGDALLAETWKNLIAQPRPPNAIITTTGYAYPSGHVAGTIVFFGILTYLAQQHWPTTKTKILTTTTYITIITIVGLDRIYLNVHWLTDIIGAALLNTFYLTLTIYLYTKILKYNQKQKTQIKQDYQQANST